MAGEEAGGGRRPVWWRRLLGSETPPSPPEPHWLTSTREVYQQAHPDLDFTGMGLEEMNATIAAHRASVVEAGDYAGESNLLAWLQERGPDDWHRSAVTWNWDQDMEPMRWVIRQPGCDAGTAVTLFARGEPGYYSQFSDMEELKARAGYMMDHVSFMIEICERWDAGQYGEWRFLPDELVHLEPGSLPWPVPEALARGESRGQSLDYEGWNEGFPPELLGRG